MFLCGDDNLSGKNYDHRRDQSVDRIEALTTIFAVDVHSYAVMSNHLHLVLTFMQALNQTIAIAANNVDRCSGKFWKGRYKCQRLEDESVVLSAMTYVDLNPIRAGMADDIQSSDHTSAQLRTKRISENKLVASFGLKPVAGLCKQQLLEMTEATYLT